jgi:hypothetical protein
LIREILKTYISRITDYVLNSRNRARIVIGTDRKDTIDSGYGDGGKNEAESASIDIVAGFDGESGNPSFKDDLSRIYLSAKADPDLYLDNRIGPSAESEPAILCVSDNIYLKARSKTKILNDNYSIVLDEDGNIQIQASSKILVTVGSNSIKIDSSGIELNGSQGLTGKIITDNDLCVGIDPVSGGPIISNFKGAGSLVTNNKVVIK